MYGGKVKVKVSAAPPQTRPTSAWSVETDTNVTTQTILYQLRVVGHVCLNLLTVQVQVQVQVQLLHPELNIPRKDDNPP